MTRIAGVLSLRCTFLLLVSHLLLDAECNKYASAAKEKLKTEKLPPCAACRVLTDSFKKGMERTARGKFEGGDTAWEEDRLKSYANSEVRLTEIQENLCKDAERGEDQCHASAADWEQAIEDWWFRRREEHPDIHDYLCVEHVKRCCPENHYGPECTPCSGYPDRVCSNNGKCKGSGTRKGNGRCACDRGYAGTTCAECASGFYESYRDENKLLCSACHAACAGACRGAGPADCLAECSGGWRMTAERGCVDVDECSRSAEYCPGNQFCVNKEGNYSCLGCDRACNGCTGDGPDMCTQCADEYELRDNICINPDILGRKKTENRARYLTYMGLIVATGILICQRNLYAAGAIGVLVGVYISASEYMIATSDIQNATPDADIIGPAR